MTKEEKRYISEMNVHIREGINTWASTCLLADADEWAYLLNYYPSDVSNVLLIFQHVCSNIGIKKGLIDEKKAVEFGERLRELVKDMTGLDPAEIVSELSDYREERKDEEDSIQ